jgi:hypothetical protein
VAAPSVSCAMTSTSVGSVVLMLRMGLDWSAVTAA